MALTKALLAAFVLLSTLNAHAAPGGAGGGHSIGVGLGLSNADQEHMNTLITRANTREGGISVSDLDSGYEGFVFYQYRFSGTMFALQLRPSFFYQNESGNGTSGKFEYGLTGFTFFPIFRLYPLESDFIKFYMQLGLGYGRADSEIQEGTASVKAVGGAFGSITGLGAEFAFSPNHSITFEGNYRYLTMERNIAKSTSGTFANNSLSQAEKDRELELDDVDFAIRLSGLQFIFGYTYTF